MSARQFPELSRSSDCPARPDEPVCERIPARIAVLGEGMTIRRVLPSRQRRTIGAFCFFDHAGPLEVGSGKGMRVGPHPHTGLQTFTWMVEGEILHRDSLGHEKIIGGDQVNLMTAGRGIAHSEESAEGYRGRLQMAQLWIALPQAYRAIEPAFEHYAELPVLERGGLRLTLLAGEFEGARAPVKVYTPLIALDIRGSGAISLPLRDDFEYGAVILKGGARIESEALEPGELLYLGVGRRTLSIEIEEGTELLLIGGAPFEEELILFWNFVGRSHEEIEEWINDWNENGDASRFGAVRGYDGPRTLSPTLRGRLKPR